MTQQHNQRYASPDFHRNRLQTRDYTYNSPQNELSKSAYFGGGNTTNLFNSQYFLSDQKQQNMDRTSNLGFLSPRHHTNNHSGIERNLFASPVRNMKLSNVGRANTTQNNITPSYNNLDGYRSPRATVQVQDYNSGARSPRTSSGAYGHNTMRSPRASGYAGRNERLSSSGLQSFGANNGARNTRSSLMPSQSQLYGNNIRFTDF